MEFAQINVLDNNGMFYCPCVKCLNDRKLNAKEIKEHVLCDRFCKSYTKWVWHGVLLETQCVSQQGNVEMDMSDHIEDMIRDVGVKAFK